MDMSSEDMSFYRVEREHHITAHKRVVMCVAIVGCIFALLWCFFCSLTFNLYYRAYANMTTSLESLPFNDSAIGERPDGNNQSEQLKIALDLPGHEQHMFNEFLIAFIMSAWFWFLVPCLGYSAVSESAWSQLFRFQFSAAYVVCTGFGAIISVFNLIYLALMWSDLITNFMDMTLQPFRNVPCPVHDNPCGHPNSSDAIDCWSHLMGWNETASNDNESLLMGKYMYCQPVPELLTCRRSSARRAENALHDLGNVQRHTARPLLLSDASSAERDYRRFNGFFATNASRGYSRHRNLSRSIAKCNNRSWCVGFTAMVNSTGDGCHDFDPTSDYLYQLHDMNAKLVPNPWDGHELSLSWVKRDARRTSREPLVSLRPRPPEPDFLDSCSMNEVAYDLYSNVSKKYYAHMHDWDIRDDKYQAAEIPIHIFSLGLGLLGCRSGMRLYMSINEGHD